MFGRAAITLGIGPHSWCQITPTTCYSRQKLEVKLRVGGAEMVLTVKSN